MSLSEGERLTHFNVQQHHQQQQRQWRISNVLPAQRFFVPTEKFWTFLSEHQHIDLVDCGTGDGQLLEEAKQRGLKLRGVDFRPRVGQSPLVEMRDATDIEWNSTRWPIVCRPDGDGWAFDVLQLAKRQGAAGLYIGFGDNYYRDINGLQARRYGDDFGVKGERLYVTQPSKDKTRYLSASRTNRKLNART